MATIVTRAGKGSPLTNNEVDSNFTNLNTDKFEKSGDTANYLTLNTAAAATTAVARVRWNTTTGTAALGLTGGNVEANVGQQLYAYVTNAESVQINKGQPVYLFGAQGDRATVKLASNTGEATSAKTLGVAAENIAAGQTGFVICQGVISNVDTAAYNPGDTLYLGATAGTLTSTKPVAPNHLVYIGVVERANAGGGQIYIRTQNGYELDELHDVLVTSRINGDVLMYNGTSGLWENKAQSNINAGSVSNGVYTLGDQTITGTKTFSSTIVGSISGNAGTVTNGVYTTGSYANPSWITSLAETKVLPSQTGNSGRYLTTNGTNTAWANVPSPNNGTLSLAVSGTGLSGSASFTADQSTSSTFTVTSNATSANTASTIVARDASGNFTAGTITAALSGNATTATTASATSAALTAGTGLSSGGTFDGSTARTFAVSYGTTSGTACQGDDSRLSDARQATNTNTQLASLGVGTGASGTAGEIRATNNITAYYSDERLKTKIGSIENALDKVKQIETMVYHANETAVELGYDASKIEVGVTAQSVQRVQPEAVKPAPIDEKYLTVQYERLVPLLIEAIKELEAQVAELKGK